MKKIMSIVSMVILAIFCVNLSFAQKYQEGMLESVELRAALQEKEVLSFLAMARDTTYKIEESEVQGIFIANLKFKYRSDELHRMQERLKMMQNQDLLLSIGASKYFPLVPGFDLNTIDDMESIEMSDNDALDVLLKGAWILDYSKTGAFINIE